jgi:hypothetical protein
MNAPQCEPTVSTTESSLPALRPLRESWPRTRKKPPADSLATWIKNGLCLNRCQLCGSSQEVSGHILALSAVGMARCAVPVAERSVRRRKRGAETRVLTRVPPSANGARHPRQPCFMPHSCEGRLFVSNADSLSSIANGGEGQGEEAPRTTSEFSPAPSLPPTIPPCGPKKHVLFVAHDGANRILHRVVLGCRKIQVPAGRKSPARDAFAGKHRAQVSIVRFDPFTNGCKPEHPKTPHRPIPNHE